MGKKRERHQNPEPFLPTEDASFSNASRKRNKPPKQHQEEQKLISTGMSSKILKEALIQQKEIQDEIDNQNPAKFIFPEEEVPNSATLDIEDDIDDFTGFADTESQFGYDEAVDEEDEKLLEAFMNKHAGPQRTLADLIVKKIKEKDAKISSGVGHPPKIDDSVIEMYKSIGNLLSKYTAGKIPKAFKHIPSMALWEDVLHLTEPQKWSPNAMYQATRIFSSNMNSRKAERFYKLVLLPRVREDIASKKKLHFALYESLKKSLYKPAAFNKGILFPLCESKTCTLREAVIVGSIITKVSIPPLHSSAALLTLARMEYCGTTSYFAKLLIEKKYALPYRVLDAMVSHFLKFLEEEERVMPVIWHQSLLAFIQRYKNELTKEDKENLKFLVEKQRHKLVTPEILRELDNSWNRGEKQDVDMSTLPSVINNPIKEDRFDVPAVPMEED